MKLVKKAQGAQVIRLTIEDWLNIGQSAGWIRMMTEEEAQQIQADAEGEEIEAQVE